MIGRDLLGIQDLDREDIEPLPLDDAALVDDVHFDLPLAGNASQPKFHRQGFFVNRFEQPGTEHGVNLDRRGNDLFGQLILLHVVGLRS